MMSVSIDTSLTTVSIVILNFLFDFENLVKVWLKIQKKLLQLIGPIKKFFLNFEVSLMAIFVIPQF